MKKIAVIGLGYVGLPLARLFATKYAVVGYDTSKDRVSALLQGKDYTCEVSAKALSTVKLPKNPFTHKQFLDIDLNHYLEKGGVIYDVKGVLPGENVVRL